MSRMGRLMGVGAALALAVLGMPSISQPALADTGHGQTIEVSTGGETYRDGTAKPVSTLVPFEAPAIVPGDSESKDLTIVNRGPYPAELTVELIDATMAEPTSDTYYDELKVNAHSARELAEAPDRTTRLLTALLDPAESEPFTLTYAFPWESTGGNTLAPTDATFRFKLRITLVDNDNSHRIEPIVCPPGQVHVDDETCVPKNDGGNGNHGGNNGGDNGGNGNNGGNTGGNGNGGNGNGGNGNGGGTGNGGSGAGIGGGATGARSGLGSAIRSLLPKTGAEVATAGTIAGGALLTGFWLLLAAKRRRRDDDNENSPIDDSTQLSGKEAQR